MIGLQYALFSFKPHINILCRYRFKVYGNAKGYTNAL